MASNVPVAATSAAVSSAPGAQPPVPVEAPQPTVRVMRLYKPVMHVAAPLPSLDDGMLQIENRSGCDLALTNFLMLPDSFGDIYLGELFSAYVSVVNGVHDAPFIDTQLSVRLQTASSTHDLYDMRSPSGQTSPSVPRTLAPNEFNDTIVQHALSVVGTHTLRVSVQYIESKSGEQKTLRKFYRFNVLNPVLISSTVLDLGNRYVIQAQLTNCTRTILNIEEVRSFQLQLEMRLHHVCFSFPLSFILRLTSCVIETC
jgi:hypothetical protein